MSTVAAANQSGQARGSGSARTPLPVAGGSGTEDGGAITVIVVPGETCGVAVVTGVARGVVVVAMGVEVAAGVAGVGEAPGVVVEVVVGEAAGVEVVRAAATSFTTLAWQVTREPPPLPEPLHWSMLTGSALVIVEVPVTVQVNPTLVPPLPEPLH